MRFRDWFNPHVYQPQDLLRGALIAAIVLGIGALWGCESNSQKCQEWGAAPGTPQYTQCMAQLYGKRNVYDALVGN